MLITTNPDNRHGTCWLLSPLLPQHQDQKTMKKIAVLTDFSENADHATRYAIELASHIKADLLLYNCFVVPTAMPMADQVGWPVNEYEELQKDSGNEMRELSARVRSIIGNLPEGAFKPLVHRHKQEGQTHLNLDELARDEEIIMYVAGSHNPGLTTILTGNHMHQLIDQAKMPLLIVPAHAKFEPLKKIVFATDLNADDFVVARALGMLAAPFNGSITLAHVCDDSSYERSKNELFIFELKQALPDAELRFQEVHRKDLQDGLTWLAKHSPFELLVMVHRDEGFWNRVFSPSETKKVATNLKQPLLVFPYPYNYLPIF